MKATLILLLSALSCAGLQAEPLPGQTLVLDTTLQKDVTADLFTAEKVLAASCTKSRVVDTRITEPPKTLGQERGTGKAVAQWTERWTIDRCGKKVFYIIHFDMRGSAGTSYKIEAPRN